MTYSLPMPELFQLEFRTKLAELSALALAISGEHHEYSEEELFEACFVFMEVFWSKRFDQLEGKFPLSKAIEMVTKDGRHIHDFIQAFTGVDMRELNRG